MVSTRYQYRNGKVLQNIFKLLHNYPLLILNKETSKKRDISQ